MCYNLCRPYSWGNLYYRDAAAAAAKSLQSCLTLCDPIDSSPPGSPVPGVLQARILEWVAISFSNAWKWKVKVKSLSCVRLLVTPWTAAYQAPPSMGFSRQEYWSGVPLPSLCRDATLPNLKYQLSMTFMIKAKIFATGQTALMICALTLSLTALPSPPYGAACDNFKCSCCFLGLPCTLPSPWAIFLIDTQPNFCGPMNSFLIPSPTHIGMKLDLPISTSIPGNSIICVSMYLIYVSPLDYELYESKNSNWFKKKKQLKQWI